MFSIDMMPGDYGDALWVECGGPSGATRILVDGGAPGTGDVLRSRLADLPEDERDIALAVVTHIDLDHISGLMELLEEELPEGLTFGDFWFNGFRELPDDDGVLGPKQGERVSFWLDEREIPQNRAFEGGAVQVDGGELAVVEDLPGDITITLLSPTPHRLRRLRSEWERIIEGIGLEPGDAGATLAGHPAEGADGILGPPDVELLAALPFRKDTSRPNASSIAFLLEHGGRRVLFTGDAFADDLEEAIQTYLHETDEDRLEVDAWKLSHHGGSKNTSPELIEMIRCENFLISTSGARYHHPNKATLARILASDGRADTVRFYFNYRSDDNDMWDDERLQDDWSYEAIYPPDGSEGLRVQLP